MLYVRELDRYGIFFFVVNILVKYIKSNECDGFYNRKNRGYIESERGIYLVLF